MPLLILGLFIVIPIVEIAVFIEVGGRIGLWNTVAVVIITAMIGTWLLRSQGLKTLESARRNMERQVFPVAELFDGICLLLAGGLLLSPGFVTDAFGFLLFVPQEDVPILDMSVEEGIKMVMSGGIVTPKDRRPVTEQEIPKVSARTYEDLDILREKENALPRR